MKRRTSFTVLCWQGERGAWILRVPHWQTVFFQRVGWMPMISDEELRAQDIEDTYQADLRGLKERRS